MDEHHPHNDEVALDRLLRDRFKATSMSNPKWVRVLKRLTADPSIVKQSFVKLVWDDSRRTFIDDRPYSYDFDFYATSMESMVGGSPRGFYLYREIEWIEFPSVVQVLRNPDNLKAGTVECAQDLGSIADRLSEVGTLDLEKSDHALRLYAYCRT